MCQGHLRWGPSSCETQEWLNMRRISGRILKISCLKRHTPPVDSSLWTFISMQTWCRLTFPVCKYLNVCTTRHRACAESVLCWVLSFISVIWRASVTLYSGAGIKINSLHQHRVLRNCKHSSSLGIFSFFLPYIYKLYIFTLHYYSLFLYIQV